MSLETEPRAAAGIRLSAALICGLPHVGKTTLINQVRRADSSHRIAMLLENCGTAAEMVARVSAVASRGECEHLMIELQGTQDPAPIANLLATPPHSDLCAPVRLDTIVAVVDASTLLHDLCSQDLVADRLPGTVGDPRAWVDVLTEQIEFADLIVVNKVDRASAETRRNLRALLTVLNPGALILESEFGAVPMSDVLATGRFDLRRAYGRSAWSRVLAGQDIPNAEVHGISAFVYYKRRPFHPRRLMSFLDESWPGVIRTRGTFWLATRMDWKGELSQVGPARRHRGVSSWWAAAVEGRTFEPQQAEEFFGIAWDAQFGDRRQELAFIGIEMDQVELCGELDTCLLTDKEMRDGREVWQSYEDPFPPWA